MNFTATFVHDGDTIDYTPDADVSAGDVVVQEDLIGVAKRDIKANTLGALAVTGVFDLPKETGSSAAIAAGAKVYWDDAKQVATTTASSNKYLGKSISAADDGDETVRVRLDQ